MFTKEEKDFIIDCLEGEDNHWGFQPDEKEIKKSIINKLNNESSFINENLIYENKKATKNSG